ncbi:ribonuclease R [Anseongella ginsenosidimutans]|uniref:Ribonuclease R n=1 Tax=Anseongella ginsenosidimutans TaxID=496056 RepID=A0A4R3KT42_9SPHI|nr:ribonuclease R [Anseongella ginsenosidimutans]QEC53146.1 ribonuclease R [Anseongella ginsenosidimutans]TCS87769.1 ribonuclease R [Anseongella ginsenosidimutans]
MANKSKQLKGLKQVFTQLVINILAKSSGKSLNYKQVSSALNITDAETREVILEILKDEAKEGTFREVSKGKFQISDMKTYVTGVIDMTATGSAYVVSDELEDDVFIAPRKLRNALHKDKVKVFVYERKGGKKQIEGEVVEILERSKKTFTGQLVVSKNFAFLEPDDRKMLHDIFIPLENSKGGKDGQKAVARITQWPEGAKNPVGEIVEILGSPGENNTEMNAILADFGFATSYPESGIREAEAFDGKIPSGEIKNRRDFRKITTFTIDPADAKDFDDAISFRKLENGNYEIGVHIADVTYYVKPGSELDREAEERGTSVYLVDRVIPMLPERLSNDLCSLVPKQDRLCFAAVFELDDKARVLNEWFGRTVIHSNRRFSYEEAQMVLDTGKGDFAGELLKLNELAYILREQRFKNGAINFETTEVKFRLDEKGVPLGVYVKERKDTHKLIEDFMLLANRLVARFIGTRGKGKNKPPFVYRSHDAPDAENIATFAQFAEKFGYKISTKSTREISRSLNFLMEDVVGRKEQNVLTHLAIRAMSKAKYTTKQTSHYGLAFDYYTHFTSPIRRYPDVMVHRLLAHYLDGGKPVDAAELEPRCVHASEMEKRAADAERASVKYKQAEYLQDNVGEVYQGVISGLTEWGMYVEIIENKCEGMVRLREIDDDFYVLDEKNYCLIGQRKKKKYQLGDEVKVRVKNVNLVKRQIDFKIVMQ